jgi:hypothetical protein
LNRVDVNEVKNTTTEATTMNRDRMNSSFFNNGNPPSNTQGGKTMQLTNDDLAALVTEFRGNVDELLAKPTQGVTATLIVVGEDGKRMHIGLQTDDLNDPHKKRHVMHAVAQGVASKKIVPAAVVMVSEVWIAPKGWSGSATDCPAREEGMMVAAAAADLRTMMAVRRVERDWQDNLVPMDWGRTGSGPSPLLEEFYFGYDAAVIGGGFNN